MIERQFPRPSEISDLLHFKMPTLNAKKRRLQDSLMIWDLRKIAKRRTPRAAFDYTDSAAEGEISLARARHAFEDIELHPDVSHPAEDVDTSCEILDGPSFMPFGIAPTGFTHLMQTEGEITGAGVAGAAGIPFTLSTLGAASIEEVKATNPLGRNWFQLYVMRKREIFYDLVERAKRAGFDTLIFTVDTPATGARLRDKCNGFSISPQISLGTVLNALPRPWWWFDFLTTPKLGFASLSSTGGTVGELLDSVMDPTISHQDLDVIRGIRDGKIIIKGVQTVTDAKKLVDADVNGILLSDHGSRQLGRAPVLFHLLPHVVRETGKDAIVMVDTDIMDGADIAACIALGADFTFIGCAYLYDLMAGGRVDVDRAIAILHEELVRIMKLLGVSSIAELEPRHITQLTRYVPVPKLTQHVAEVLVWALFQRETELSRSTDRDSSPGPPSS